jgi:hypothetical protein
MKDVPSRRRGVLQVRRSSCHDRDFCLADLDAVPGWNQRHGRDEGAFLNAYPAAGRGFKPLFDEIQKQRLLRGEIVGRASKNGKPSERGSTSSTSAGPAMR